MQDAKKAAIHKLSTHSKPLINLVNQDSFALCFSGQGFSWMKMLRHTLKQGVQDEVSQLVDSASEIIAPVTNQLSNIRPQGFDPILWAESRKDNVNLLSAAVSAPGIFLSQIANVKVLQQGGLDTASVTATLGHSQGVLGCHFIDDMSQATQLLAIAELVGAAATLFGKTNNMVIQNGLYPMVMVQGVEQSRLDNLIETLYPSESTNIIMRPNIGLINSNSAFVITGQPKAVKKVCDTLVSEFIASDKEIAKSMIMPLDVEIAFHHPSFAVAIEQVVDWADKCGLNGQKAKLIAEQVLLNQVNWVEQCQRVAEKGVKYILGIGPSGGISALTKSILVGQGIEVLDVSSAKGKKALFGR